MKIKYILFVLSLLIIVLDIRANDDKKYKIDKASWGEMDGAQTVNYIPYNLAPDPSIFVLRLDPGFSTDSYTIGPEISTGISGFYDYKTNGEANHYIQVDPLNPLNLHSVDVVADTSDPTGATSRRTQYAISSDGGATWLEIVEVPDLRSGYPVLKLRNGTAVIANHSAATGVVNANLYIDILPQGGGFTQYAATLPFSIWPQIEVFSNGNVGMLSRPQHPAGSDFDTIFYQTWSGTTLGPKSVAYVSTPPYTGTVGSNARFNIAQNGAGRVTQAFNGVLEDDTLTNSKVWSRTSTDNGVTWGPLTVLFSPFIENGTDTVAIAGGSDLVYKPNSNLFMYSCAATANGTYADGRIYLIRSDGMRSVITTAAAVGATTTFAQTMSFVFNLDQPAMGWSADGNILYCVYSVVKPDLGASGYNSRDVYYQRSTDDGQTWGTPVQITNTPNIDECYPSVSNWNKGTTSTSYELNITYMKDPGVGPTSFGGSAPASRNFQIYRKISAANVIGISGNEVKLNDFRLSQNYPNPFNPVTKINYTIPSNVNGEISNVKLIIYNNLGMEVKTLVNETQSAGNYEVNFNGENLSSGVYFYVLKAGNFTETKKMTLLK